MLVNWTRSERPNTFSVKGRRQVAMKPKEPYNWSRNVYAVWIRFDGVMRALTPK